MLIFHSILPLFYSLMMTVDQRTMLSDFENAMVRYGFYLTFYPSDETLLGCHTVYAHLQKCRKQCVTRQSLWGDYARANLKREACHILRFLNACQVRTKFQLIWSAIQMIWPRLNLALQRLECVVSLLTTKQRILSGPGGC